MSLETAFEVGRLYTPIKSIADTLTASQKDLFVRLPGLIAYWPFGIRRGGGIATDHSGNGLDGTQVGTCQTGYDGNAFTHLGNGTNYFLNSSTSFNLTGLESYIDPSIRGLTLGGWFKVDELPVSTAGLISKFGVVTDYGYALAVESSGILTYSVSFNGSAIVYVQSTTVTLGSWHFMAARFVPSATLDVFLDGVKFTNSTAIPASCYASSQTFEVGRYSGITARILHGRARDVFVCASSLSDELIEQIRVTSQP